MIQFLIVFMLLFVPLMIVAILIQGAGKRRMERIRSSFEAKSWRTTPNSAFVCPPFLQDYKSIVHFELHNDQTGIAQIVEHRMAFKIYLDTVTLSYDLASFKQPSHLFFLDKKMGMPRSTKELAVVNVSSPNITAKYTVYSAAGTSQALLDKVRALLEPVCSSMPYTCVEIKDRKLYVAIISQNIPTDQMLVVADQASSLAKQLDMLKV